MNEFSVILFYSTNYSIWAAKVLKNEGIYRKMIPVPRHVSSDCGYCIEIKNEDMERVKDILLSNKIEFEKIENL